MVVPTHHTVFIIIIFFLKKYKFLTDIADAKKKKIENSGVVAFDVYAAKDKDGSIRYKIDPKSLLTIYRGFTAK